MRGKAPLTSVRCELADTAGISAVLLREPGAVEAALYAAEQRGGEGRMEQSLRNADLSIVDALLPVKVLCYSHKG